MGREPKSFPMNNFWAWHVKESREEAAREARIWLTVRGTLYPPYINEVLDPDEAAIVNKNINAFIRAYNKKSDVHRGRAAGIVQKLVDRCTSASPLAELDREIERLRDFERAGLDARSRCGSTRTRRETIRLLGERVVPALALICGRGVSPDSLRIPPRARKYPRAFQPRRLVDDPGLAAQHVGRGARHPNRTGFGSTAASSAASLRFSCAAGLPK